MVLGIGNVLHGDDGFGIHVVNALNARNDSRFADATANLRDGGTIGLALLPEIEDSSALIVVDAAEIGAEPGTMRVMLGAEMDAQLSGRKRTVHEVSLADLMSAAELTGRKPKRRALIAVQPGSTDWQIEPTAPVTAAIPPACDAVLSLIERWNDAG
jgi:hydrogenase maturation protease